MSEISPDFVKAMNTFDLHNAQRLLGETLRYLQNVFRVEHVSIIEGVHLRKIAEEELKRHWKNMSAAEAGLLSSLNVTDPVGESAWRWMTELYGISPWAMPGVNRTYEDEESIQLLQIRRDQAHHLRG